MITSSAVSALMNIQFLTYTIVERLSYSNKHRLGNHYVKDVVKSIQENEEKKEELRQESLEQPMTGKEKSGE